MSRSFSPVRTALALASVLVVVATMLTAPAAQAASGDGSISGQVVDQNGVPAQWYTVSLERYDDVTTQVGSVITDADGRFSFASLPDGTYGFNSFCEEQCVWMTQYATFDSSTVTIENGAAVVNDGTLERDTWIVAGVKDSAGMPQAGLEAYAASTTGSIYCYQFEPEPGAYVTSCPKGGTFRVSAQAKDLPFDGRVSKTLTVATGHVGQASLVLPPQVTVTGRAVDAAGKPVSGLSVDARTPGTSRCGSATGRTSKNGTYEIECWTHQSLTIEISQDEVYHYLTRTRSVAVKASDVALSDTTVQKGGIFSATVTGNVGQDMKHAPELSLYRWTNDQWLPYDSGSSIKVAAKKVRLYQVPPGTYRVLVGETTVDEPQKFGYPTHGRVFAGGGKKYKITYGQTIGLGTYKLLKAAKTKTSVPTRKTSITTSTRPTATVKVTGGAGKPTGILTMALYGRSNHDYFVDTTLTPGQKGKRTVTGPKVPKGTYEVRFFFTGHGKYLDSRSGSYTLTVR